MHLGIRRVRSAGKASGSIEITLPPELGSLESIACQVLVRGGARPEIVLQPELTPAALIFARIWSRLHHLLELAGEIGEFPAGEVDAVLLPLIGNQPTTAGRPTLVYAYALQIGRDVVSGWPASSPEFLVTDSLAGRSIELERAIVGATRPLAIVAGRRLGLSGTVALVWGHALVTLAVSNSVAVLEAGEMTAGGAEGQYELMEARRAWHECCGAHASPLCVLNPQPNDNNARMALQRIISQFRAWQERPDNYQATRVAWQTPGWFTGTTQHTLER